MLKLLFTVVGLLALTDIALADDAVPQSKDRNTAIELSAGGTALSAGLVGVGIGTHNATLIGVGFLSSIITPSAGEIYAGKPLTVGLGIRAVSAVTAIVGTGMALQCIDDSNPGCDQNGAAVGVLVVASSVIGYATGIVYDIATAGTAVDDYNNKLHLHIAPTVMRTPSSGSMMGVGIGGSF